MFRVITTTAWPAAMTARIAVFSRLSRMLWAERKRGLLIVV
jgi:hypothetical protein